MNGADLNDDAYESIDPTSPTARHVIVRFDLADQKNRVEVDIGDLNPRIALVMVAEAVELLEAIDGWTTAGRCHSFQIPFCPEATNRVKTTEGDDDGD